MATQFSQPAAAENQTTMIIKKKTMGRRKIEIKPILDKKNLAVTFSKRRGGIFKTASELSILCGADIAIIVRSPANKFYTFGNPNVDSVLDQYETGCSSASSYKVEESCSSSKTKYMEAFKRLENEKKKKTSTDLLNNWWDMEFEGMELSDLEEYLVAIEGLKSKVMERIDEMNKLVSMDDHKYDDWESLLCENPFINAGETSTSEDISTGCSSSWDLITLPTGVECYADNGNGGLEDIFNNI